MTDVTQDSVGLSWTVPEGEFDSFVVQYKDRDGQPQVVPVAADQREVTIPGLEPSRKYKFLLFGIQDGKRRSPVSVEAKTGKSDPQEAKPEAPAFALCHTPDLHSLLQGLPFVNSSVAFKEPYCLLLSKADESRQMGPVPGSAPSADFSSLLIIPTSVE